PQTVGAHITRGDRGSLASTVQSLTGRDTAEQVWRDTHGEFFWAYSLADAVVLAAIGLASWGAAQDKRRRRARGWRVAGVFGAAWLALVLLRRSAHSRPSSRRPALLAVAAVAVFAVFASGWPGFGGKVGGTIAMVPCFLLLAMAVAGVRLNWRRVLLVAVSGLALFAVFALISYLVPATGHSDISVFAGNTLHGRSGGLLPR